jgi:hypothetical protein
LTLIAPREFKENNNEYICYNINKEKTYIIRTSAVNKYRNVIPKYKLVIDKNDNALIPVNQLLDENMINEISKQKNTIQSLLKNFNGEINNQNNVPKKIGGKKCKLQ